MDKISIFFKLISLIPPKPPTRCDYAGLMKQAESPAPHEAVEPHKLDLASSTLAPATIPGKVTFQMPNTQEIVTLPAKVELREMPTTSETVTDLKRRLAKELYKIELDLVNGGRIAGHACDCLGRSKHSLGLEAITEELMPMDPNNPTYGQIQDWLKDHESDFRPEEIEKRPPQFYRDLATFPREWRKELTKG